MFATVGKVPADLIHTFTVQLKQFADCIKRRKPSVSCVATVKTSNFSVAEKKKEREKITGIQECLQAVVVFSLRHVQKLFQIIQISTSPCKPQTYVNKLAAIICRSFNQIQKQRSIFKPRVNNLSLPESKEFPQTSGTLPVVSSTEV